MTLCKTTTMTNNNRQVKLLIVRHGEREDEAIKVAYWNQQKANWNALRSSKGEKYAKMNLNTAVKQKIVQLDPCPMVDTLDPLLTKQGHQQAKASFLAIAKALPRESKVAVFSSPLRRAIGTSLMIGSVPWDESIHWSAPAQAAYASSSNSNSNEGCHRTKTIPVTVLDGLGDFASRIYHTGGTSLLSQKGLLRCSSTLSGNDGGCESPFVQTLASMPSHESGDMFDRTNDVRFWTPEGQSLSGTIDPHTKHYRAETVGDRIREIQKQNTYFAKVAKREQKAKKRGSFRPSQPPPNPLRAVDEAIRTTLARGCDTCLIVAHREAIRDVKEEECNHLFSIALPYCCIGSFGATTRRRNDRVYYNFWSLAPLEKFDRTSIPQCLSPNEGLVRVMVTHDNGKLQCLGCLDIREWRDSLPPEVWAKTTQHNGSKVAHLTNYIEAGDYNGSLQNNIQSLAQQGHVLYFDSTVRTYGNASAPRTFRFRLSTQNLPDARVLLYYNKLP